jgi:TatA/E family protein of Tat protein translocase
MFGSLGLPELIMIFVLALLLFGPRKLPEIGKSLGKAMGEFRRASNDLKRSLEEEVAADELRHVGSELRETGRAAISSVTGAADEAATGDAAPPAQADQPSTPVEPR